MKIKVIHRNPEDFCSKRAGEVQKYFRNRDPNMHPFERAREYTRALKATKLDKIFAKPLVCVLDGHTDSIQCITKCHHNNTDVYTGSCDGEVRMWDIAAKECVKAIKAHEGFVRGVCTSEDDRWLFSCGNDKKIKQWNIEKNFNFNEMDLDELNAKGNLVTRDESDVSPLFQTVTPVNVFVAKSIQTAVDHHWHKPLIVSSGETVDIWDHHRSSPVHSFQWGCDALYTARFNPAEPYLVASTGSDNSIGLYDIRGNSPLRKVVLKMASNALCWNPMEPLNFVVANEDQNLYTFDMRKLDSALYVHKDFTNAVLDVDYSPTGREIVAASFDRTVRIFDHDAFKSKDVYHTKRMQIVLSCRFSGDGRYVFSGSGDMCLRVWKADASAPMGVRSYRERQAIAYRRTLKEKYGHLPEIKRIARHHHTPILIKKTADKKREMEAARKRREANLVKHSKPGSVNIKGERKKAIVQEVE